MAIWRVLPLAVLSGAGLAGTPPVGDDVVAVPPALANAVQQLFATPDPQAGWLDARWDPNLIVGEWTTITLVALSASPSADLSLGSFSFEADERGHVRLRRTQFPGATLRASKDARIAGTELTLRADSGHALLFAPGERIGFFIEPALARAQGETIDVWAGKSEPLDPHEFHGFTAGTFTTLDAFNPEARQAERAYARHAAMMWMPAIPGFANEQPFLVVGFEDAQRGPEHHGDFSDVVFAVIPGKPGALSATRVHNAALGDVDGDGVDGVFDAYPFDAERAFLAHMPASGCVTIALEDGYPDIGDLDYNDVLVRASWTLVSDSQGRIKDLLASLHLLDCDPRRQYRVGLRLPPLPAHVQGNMWTERFWGWPEQHALIVRTIEDARTLFDGCLPAPFPSTRMLGNSLERGRSQPAAARVQVSFNQALDPSWLLAMPLEPYFVIQRGDQELSVHLPGARGLPRRAGELAMEAGPQSYLSRAGYPFILVVPKAWQAPPPGVPVGRLYPGFRTWVGSRGVLAGDWYEQARTLESAPVIELDSSEREWSLRLDEL